MDRKLRLILLMLALLLVFAPLLSCHGDDDDDEDDKEPADDDDEDNESLTCEGDFSNAAACGGDPEGSWAIDSVCSDYDYQALIAKMCPDATVNSVDYDFSGTLDVEGENWAFAASGSTTYSVTFPSTCFQGAIACDQMQMILAELLPGTTCNEDTAGCNCTASVDGTIETAGTYSVSDGEATINTGEKFYFCVGGDTMLLRQIPEVTEEETDAGDSPVFLLTK